jgi:diadenosine tetraphosphate (Ap4A) HIT family hydrolase
MTMIPTPFFDVEEKKRWTNENELAFAVTNKFPVRDGHLLILPKRIVTSPMDMTPQEMAAIHELAQSETARLGKEFGTTDFTIGFNDGELAGQSVAHAHMHIIPRVSGDTDKVRGGILNMFKELPEYYSEESSDDSEPDLTASDIKAIHKLGNYLCGDLQTQEEFEINENIESYIKENTPTVFNDSDLLVGDENIGEITIKLKRELKEDENLDLGFATLSIDGRSFVFDTSTSSVCGNVVTAAMNDTQEDRDDMNSNFDLTFADLKNKGLLAEVYVGGEVGDTWEVDSITLNIIGVGGLESIPMTED